MPIVFAIIQHFTRCINQDNYIRKIIRGIKMCKEKIKLPLFDDDRIVYLKNPREPMIKLDQ